MESKDLDYIAAENNQVLTLIIYDVVNDKRRVKLAKYLQGYGVRVQMSAFEAFLSPSKYEKFVREIQWYVSKEDSVRIYRVGAGNQVKTFGTKMDYSVELVVVA